MDKIKKKVNQRVLRFFVVSTITTTVLWLLLYVEAGLVAIPPESPLVNPNFVIRPLNDPSIPIGENIHPETTPINFLYDGRSWTAEALLVITIYSGVVIAAIFCNNTLSGIAILTIVTVKMSEVIASIIANIPFSYGALRLGAQPLIDGSHRWRVIIAYLLIWRDNEGIFPQRAITMAILIFALIGSLVAACIEYVLWRKEQRIS